VIKVREILKKGFTLLEIMVVCCIIVVMTTAGSLTLSGRAEKDGLRELKLKIPLLIENMSWKSMENGIRYDVEFNFEENFFKVFKEGEVVIRESMPKHFIYEDINGNRVIKRTTTSTGNMNMPFSIYVFSRDKKKVLYKITADTTSPSKCVIVRKYKPTEEATVANCKEERLFPRTWKRDI